MLYNNGTPLDKLRIILGHESTTTTEIYAHMGLDDIQKEVAHSEKGFLRKLGHKIRMKQYNQFKMSFRETQVLRGRDEDMKIVDYYLREGLSFILHGQPGIGKTFFAQHIQNIIYIEQFNRKTTLIELLLKHQGHDVSEHRELIRKEYSRLRIDEIFHEVENMGGFNHPVVIDNIEQHTKGEKKMITRLGKCTQVIGISASSRMEITRMFDTEHELLAVNKDTRRQIIYEMCHVPDLRQKDRILDKIMDKSGDNLKEAKYVITQMNLGRRPEDIVTSSEASNEVSIAPFIILGFMVLVLLVIKTVAVSIFTTVIIVSWLARFAFTRFLFNPALRASKNGGGR
jgi:DNA replication protein DnaC